MRRVYLDWNATAPLRPEARAAMVAAMDVAGNPSSVHAEGRAAKAVVERARAQVATAVGCKPAEVIFTSGATEAASVLSRLPADHDVLVDPTAHDCLWSHLRMGPPADTAGHVLAMGLANSETGIITEPPSKVDGRWAHGARRADWLLLDVVQAIGRVPFSFAWSGADMAIMSAHKLGGPKGTGALILRDGLDITPWATGGGQEMGRRAGTENIIGIAGFGAAAEAAARDLADGVWDRVAELRNILDQALSAPEFETISVGNDVPRLPNTLCIIAPGWKGETQVMAMDLAGFAVSAGSACSSGKVQASRVLRAMGYDDALAAQAIRVSLGPDVTEDEVLRFADMWRTQYRKIRGRAA
jgi:cysteine desulfurase